MSREDRSRQQNEEAKERVRLHVCEALNQLQRKHERGCRAEMKEPLRILKLRIRAAEAFTSTKAPPVPDDFTCLRYKARQKILEDLIKALC